MFNKERNLISVSISIGKWKAQWVLAIEKFNEKMINGLRSIKHLVDKKSNKKLAIELKVSQEGLNFL